MRKRPLRKRSAKQVKVAVLDALWSRVVRTRAGWKCEACGSERSLQGAHLYPKGGYPALRHDPSNGACLCWSCHLGPKGAHKSPLEWGGAGGKFAVILLHRGEDPDRLALKARTSHKPDKAAVKFALEAELNGSLRTFSKR